MWSFSRLLSKALEAGNVGLGMERSKEKEEAFNSAVAHT
jgi:hypothetical protein